MDELRSWQGMLFDKEHWMEFCEARGIHSLTAEDMWNVLAPAPRKENQNGT